MSQAIKLRKVSGTYSIRAAGAVLGESANVVEMTEGDAARLFVPRKDLAMAFFDETEQTETHAGKGVATYLTLQAKSGPIPRAAWSYYTPETGLEAIAGYVAFDDDKITVEQT